MPLMILGLKAHHAIPVSDELGGLRVEREGLGPPLIPNLEEELQRTDPLA